jgi:hypothetical protein
MSSGKLYSNGKARRCAHALQVIVSVLLETMLLSVSGVPDFASLVGLCMRLQPKNPPPMPPH